jgi:hypothetical protein
MHGVNQLGWNDATDSAKQGKMLIRINGAEVFPSFFLPHQHSKMVSGNARQL